MFNDKEFRQSDLDATNINKRIKTIVEETKGFWFNTREGHQFGPYDNPAQAKIARQLFIYSITGVTSELPNHLTDELKTLFLIEQFEVAAVADDERAA